MTRMLTLEVEEDILARAEVAAQARGGDVRSELLLKLEELGSSKALNRLAAIERSLARANANPHYIEGGMGDREERNSRR